MKPQDIVLLLKLAQYRRSDAAVRQVDLALALQISQAEVHRCIVRAMDAGLFSAMPSKSRLDPTLVHRRALAEVVVHAVRYFFPTRLGALGRGTPTAWGHPGIRKRFMADDEDLPVWPDADGSARGQIVEPLYAALPAAARADEELHMTLSLLDCMRVGRVREREYAAAALRDRLMS